MVSGIWLRLGLTLSQGISSIILMPNIPCASAVLIFLCLDVPSPYVLSLDRQKSLLSLSDCKSLCLLLCLSGKFTRRGSSDAATEMESLSTRHSHSHHTLMSELPDHSNSHGENTIKEGGSRQHLQAGVQVPFTISCFHIMLLPLEICVLVLEKLTIASHSLSYLRVCSELCSSGKANTNSMLVLKMPRKVLEGI